jgi:hypothetical protein
LPDSGRQLCRHQEPFARGPSGSADFLHRLKGPGQTRAIRSSLATISPACSTKAGMRSNARAPGRTGISASSRSCRAGQGRNGPSRIARPMTPVPLSSLSIGLAQDIEQVPPTRWSFAPWLEAMPVSMFGKDWRRVSRKVLTVLADCVTTPSESRSHRCLTIHDDTSEPFALPTVAGKKVSASFGGGRITSDGGVILLARAERNLGISELAGSGNCRSPRSKPDRASAK